MSRFLYLHKETLGKTIFAFHMLWVVILIGGGVVSIAVGWYRPIHFAVVGVTVVSQLLFLGCPLTTLEVALRNYGGKSIEGFKGGFLIHYLDKRFGLRPSVVALTVGTWLLFAFATVLFIAFLFR